MHLNNPRFEWGSGFSSVLYIPYPQSAIAGSTPRDGSVWKQISSGEEDAWIRHDYTLSFDVGWIPLENSTTPLATGWNGANGFRAFLEHARAKNVIRFFPNGSDSTYVNSYLADPMSGLPTLEDGGVYYRISLTIRNPSTPYA